MLLRTSKNMVAKMSKELRSELQKRVFERVFYYCKLSGISFEDYFELFKAEAKERGFEDDLLSKR